MTCWYARQVKSIRNMAKAFALNKEQYELLCECIRYRAADNSAERETAVKLKLSTSYYDNMAARLNDLKTAVYNL